jgi:hypothetical protein
MRLPPSLPLSNKCSSNKSEFPRRAGGHKEPMNENRRQGTMMRETEDRDVGVGLKLLLLTHQHHRANAKTDASCIQ